MLFPLLFSIYSIDCTSGDFGLIQDCDESTYRQEVDWLSLWCRHNNLELSTSQTVEMTVDFEKVPTPLPPLTIHGCTVSGTESFKLKWERNIAAITKKAQQRMYFLCQLRKHNLPKELLCQFYRATTESILCSSVTVWFSSAT